MAPRTFLPVVALMMLIAVGCSVDPATTRPASASSAQTIGDNEFIPEDVNIGDCVSSLPRPNCGTSARGGSEDFIILGLMVFGLSIIGWRIVRSVRARERASGQRQTPKMSTTSSVTADDNTQP